MFNPKKAGGRGGQFEPPCGFSKNVFFRGGGGVGETCCKETNEVSI